MRGRSMLAVRLVVGWALLLGGALFAIFLLTAAGEDHPSATTDKHDLAMALGLFPAREEESCAETPERGRVEDVHAGRVSEC